MLNPEQFQWWPIVIHCLSLSPTLQLSKKNDHMDGLRIFWRILQRRSSRNSSCSVGKNFPASSYQRRNWPLFLNLRSGLRNSENPWKKCDWRFPISLVCLALSERRVQEEDICLPSSLSTESQEMYLACSEWDTRFAWGSTSWYDSGWPKSLVPCFRFPKQMNPL